MRIKSFLVSILASLSIGAANAALLIDWSPDTTGAHTDCCLAQNDFQYLQHFYLSGPTALTGFAYYTQNYGNIPAVGRQIFVTIVEGPFQNGKPPVDALYLFLPLTVTSNQFPGSSEGSYPGYGLTGIFVSLPSVLLDEGTYLIGFYGDPPIYGPTLLSGSSAPFNEPLPQQDIHGNFSLSELAPVGTLAMRLYGESVTVPEPGTLALLAGSVALLSLIGRRRQPTKLREN